MMGKPVTILLIFAHLALFLAPKTYVSCEAVGAYDPQTLFEEYFKVLPETLRSGFDGLPGADPTVNNFNNYVYLNTTSQTYMYVRLNNTVLEGCSKFNVSMFDLSLEEGFLFVDFKTATSEPVRMKTDYEVELHVEGKQYDFMGRFDLVSSSYRRKVSYTVGLNTETLIYFLRSIYQSDKTLDDYVLVVEYTILPPHPILKIFESLYEDVKAGIAEIAFDAFASSEMDVSANLLVGIQQNSSLPLVR